MLKFSHPNISFQNFIIFRDNIYPELFYYLNKTPQISFFVERPAVLFEYQKTGVKINSLLVRFKVNYIANPFEISELQDFLRNKFRIRHPYIAPAPMSNSKITLQLTYLKEVIWTSLIEQQSMDSRFTQIAQFVVRDDVADKFYQSVIRGGSNVHVYYHIGVIGMPIEFPAKIFIQWSQLYKVFDFSLNKSYSADEIYEQINKWIVKNLEDISFNKLDDTTKILATQDIVNEVCKAAFKKIFYKKNQQSENPVYALIGNSVNRNDLDSKFYLKELSTIHSDAETIQVIWKNNKVIDFKFKMNFKELFRNITPIEQYFVDVTNLMQSKSLNLYIGIAQHTFDFVNIRKIEVQVDIIHKKTNFIEKKLNFIFEKGGQQLIIEPFVSIDKYSSYIINFKVFYSIVETNNYSIQSIEKNPNVENKTHLYIDPTVDFNVYFFRFLLDKAKRLSIFDSILARINFRSSIKNLSIWEISESLDKNARENTLAYVSTFKNVEAKVDVEYYLNQKKVANTSYSNIHKNNYIVDNPFENMWEVNVECIADWTKTNKVLLDVFTYELNSYTIYSKQIHFTENDTTNIIGFSKRHFLEEHTFYYKIICVSNKGSIICQSGLKHTGEKLIISDQIISTRTIHGYLPETFNFSKRKCTKIGWIIRYIDKSNHINYVSEPKYFTPTIRYHQITHQIANHYFSRYEYCYTLEFDDHQEREKSVWFAADQEQIFLKIE